MGGENETLDALLTSKLDRDQWSVNPAPPKQLLPRPKKKKKKTDAILRTGGWIDTRADLVTVREKRMYVGGLKSSRPRPYMATLSARFFSLSWYICHKHPCEIASHSIK